MAAIEPAKAPPLYEPGGAKSTAWRVRGAVPLWRMIRALLLAPLLLAACGPAADSPANNMVDPPATPAPPPPPPKSFLLEEKTDLIDFHTAWSAEAAAVSQLVERFTAAMNKEKAELTASAREDRAFRKKQGLPFHAYSSSSDYLTAGQSQRLLSLSIEVASFTGGAHGNSGTGALLWDRAARRELGTPELFAEPANRDRLLTQSWCDALNIAREEKRGEPVGDDGLFDDCPALDDIALVPTDKDGNGRFETFVLTASPYVAGPYVEGEYQVELPVTANHLAALKEGYRDSFETLQPQ